MAASPDGRTLAAFLGAMCIGGALVIAAVYVGAITDNRNNTGKDLSATRPPSG